MTGGESEPLRTVEDSLIVVDSGKYMTARVDYDKG